MLSAPCCDKLNAVIDPLCRGAHIQLAAIKLREEPILANGFEG